MQGGQASRPSHFGQAGSQHWGLQEGPRSTGTCQSRQCGSLCSKRLATGMARVTEVRSVAEPEVPRLAGHRKDLCFMGTKRELLEGAELSRVAGSPGRFLRDPRGLWLMGGVQTAGRAGRAGDLLLSSGREHSPAGSSGGEDGFELGSQGVGGGGTHV